MEIVAIRMRIITVANYDPSLSLCTTEIIKEVCTFLSRRVYDRLPRNNRRHSQSHPFLLGVTSGNNYLYKTSQQKG